MTNIASTANTGNQTTVCDRPNAGCVSKFQIAQRFSDNQRHKVGLPDVCMHGFPMVPPCQECRARVTRNPNDLSNPRALQGMLQGTFQVFEDAETVWAVVRSITNAGHSWELVCSIPFSWTGRDGLTVIVREFLYGPPHINVEDHIVLEFTVNQGSEFGTFSYQRHVGS